MEQFKLMIGVVLFLISIGMLIIAVYLDKLIAMKNKDKPSIPIVGIKLVYPILGFELGTIIAMFIKLV